MQRYRPSSVFVLGILQLVFGILTLLGSVCGGGLQLAGGSKLFAPPPGAQAPPDTEAMIRARLPYYGAIQYAGLGLGVVVGTVMVVSGLGLINMRPWARGLTIGYACYNIVSGIIGFIFNLTVYLPVMRDVFAELRADPKFPPQAAGILSMTETFTSAVMYFSLAFLAYPVVLLVFMFAPHVRAAFRGEPERRDDEGGADEAWPDDEADTPHGGGGR
jgi:hypothetical protein